MKYTVISFDELGRLDSSSVRIFREKLAQVTTDNDAIVLDFTGIDFIDSTGLGAIIAVANSTWGKTELLISGIKEDIRRIMELTRLHSVLPLYSSVSAAIETLQQKTSTEKFKKAA
ncbi:MAG: STAS domain-containing protein [Candidatus Electrothrix aestuarii]|uniref:STAS domain-containing protein n=1 Tax=Candidatus Electrothrix aestuarii TaxID=3062594 RepID=A0AAU8M0P0_9BACT|nr:STAS domain-containing protein [Candidatus Electrothrix aestuarii]